MSGDYATLIYIYMLGKRVRFLAIGENKGKTSKRFFAVAHSVNRRAILRQ